jgi:uncharacterized membrane protein
MSTVRSADAEAAAGLPARRPAVPRLDSVDMVRGVVMVLMALDHARDFFTIARFDPLDLSRTWPALFLTRWITHFCAPVFVFLAGTGAYLGAVRGKSRRELSWFLFTRGLWLVVLELTVVHFGWTFQLHYGFLFLQVIWAIGVSMIVLAALVHLPTWAVTAFGVVLIAAHDLLDGVKPEAFGSLGWLWTVLHVQAPVRMPGGFEVFIAYPVLPWIGVLAAGYGFGALYRMDGARRRTTLRVLGAGMIGLFVALRFSNVYGDPVPWTPQRSGILTVLSFVNTQKYPPSLLFLLMTLGPAILWLSFLERPAGALARPFVVFGRVPLFYYVLHLPLIHLMAVVYAFSKYGPAASTIDMLHIPADYGVGLPVIYAVWIATVLMLYPACAWFARLKSRRRDPWLSYL